MDGERQMSLEELIQDETTDEVIESTTTASQKMSVDNTTASEVTAADATSLPEHDFIKKLITGKTGKKKGKTTISYMILMGSTPTLLKQVFIISCLAISFHACMLRFLIRRGIHMILCSQ